MPQLSIPFKYHPHQHLGLLLCLLLSMRQLRFLPVLVHAPHQPASVLLCSLRGKDDECILRVAAHFQTCMPSQLLMLLDLVAAVRFLSPADSRTACT